MRIVPFERAHLRAINAQKAQRDWELGADGDPGQAWTAVVDGRPIACAGMLEVWTGRAYVWALLGEDAGPHLLSITRAIRSALARSGFARIEMAVDAQFEAGQRWAEMLGFRCETPEPMRRFFPNGNDAYMYARIA
jgi:hypothetical protein